MSLVRLGVRIAAVHALIGRTYAASTVYDSKITPVDELAREEPAPFIVVTTDDDDQDITGRDVNAGYRRLDLVIEYGLASKLTDGDIEVPHTDAGMEAILDVIQRQIARALMDNTTAYSAVFKALVPRINAVTSRRGASAEDGVRFAARQMVVSVDTINDPGFGVALEADHPLKTLADLLAAAPATAGIAALITSAAVGEAIPDYDRVLIDLGMTPAAARGIAIGGDLEGEAAPALTEIEIVSEDDDGHAFTVTEDDAGDQFPDA